MIEGQRLAPQVEAESRAAIQKLAQNAKDLAIKLERAETRAADSEKNLRALTEKKRALDAAHMRLKELGELYSQSMQRSAVLEMDCKTLQGNLDEIRQLLNGDGNDFNAVTLAKIARAELELAARKVNGKAKKEKAKPASRSSRRKPPDRQKAMRRCSKSAARSRGSSA